MQRSELDAYIGSLTNDPSHDRYSADIIHQEMDAVEERWNIAADILKTTATITVVGGTASYTFGATTAYPIKILRVTHKGLELRKRDKAWFDLYATDDWTDDAGTPTDFYFDDTATLGTVRVYPIPQDADAGANLTVEYVYPHTSMGLDTNYPWNDSNAMIPYHAGFAKEVSANLLARDPSNENIARFKVMKDDAKKVLDDVVNYFAFLKEEESPRLRGGRHWKY